MTIRIETSDHLNGELKITVAVDGQESGIFWFRDSDTASTRDARADTIGLLIGGIIREQVRR